MLCDPAYYEEENLNQKTIEQFVSVAALLGAFPECSDEAERRFAEFAEKYPTVVEKIGAAIESAREDEVMRAIGAVLNAATGVLLDALEADAGTA